MINFPPLYIKYAKNLEFTEKILIFLKIEVFCRSAVRLKSLVVVLCNRSKRLAKIQHRQIESQLELIKAFPNS